jgi:hypothetical protein
MPTKLPPRTSKPVPFPIVDRYPGMREEDVCRSPVEQEAFNRRANRQTMRAWAAVWRNTYVSAAMVGISDESMAQAALDLAIKHRNASLNG